VRHQIRFKKYNANSDPIGLNYVSQFVLSGKHLEIKRQWYVAKHNYFFGNAITINNFDQRTTRISVPEFMEQISWSETFKTAFSSAVSIVTEVRW
jgi:hypothetical protein